MTKHQLIESFCFVGISTKGLLEIQAIIAIYFENGEMDTNAQLNEQDKLTVEDIKTCFS